MLLFLGLSFVEPSSGAEAPAIRYAKELDAFKQSDRTNPPPSEAVLFLGSSSIRLWKTLKTDFPKTTLLNRGFGGSIITDSTTLIDPLVFAYNPRQIVFYAGDNDIAQGKSAEQVSKDFSDFEQAVHAKLPKTSILFISIKPSPSRWKLENTVKEANRLIQQTCQNRPNLRYLDVFSLMLNADGLPKPELFVADQLHLNNSGYQIWAKALRESLFLDPVHSK